jgi:hypothetical protein
MFTPPRQRMRTSCALIGSTVVAVLAVPRVATCATPLQTQWVLLVDLTEATPTVVSVSADDLTCEDQSGTVGKKSYQEQLDAACGEKPDPDVRIGDVYERTKCFTSRSTLRWVSHREDLLHVYVFYRGDRPSVGFKEDSRKTRLRTDFETLAKLGLAIATTKEALAGTPPLSCVASMHKLTQERANLAVSVSQEAAVSPLKPSSPSTPSSSTTHEDMPGAKPQASNDEKGVKKASVSLVTGPTEHWFLSADLPIGRLDELKYDSATATFKATKTPSQFYIGVDYMVGDLIHDPAKAGSVWSNVVLKAVVKASKHPMESVGLAVGLRGHYIIDLDTFSPFLGVFYTRADPSAPPNATGTKGQWTLWKVGASVNLDQALGWLKGDGK